MKQFKSNKNNKEKVQIQNNKEQLTENEIKMRTEIIDNRQFGSFCQKSLQEYSTKHGIQDLADTNIEK